MHSFRHLYVVAGVAKKVLSHFFLKHGKVKNYQRQIDIMNCRNACKPPMEFTPGRRTHTCAFQCTGCKQKKWTPSLTNLSHFWPFSHAVLEIFDRTSQK